MSDISAEDLRKEVDNAIAKVLVGGQSYRIGTRQLTRADLSMLRQLKNELAMQDGNINDTILAEFEGR